jgi:DNA end-binding protein Ku
MAGRALWKAFIHFGDYTIPVSLHTAVREERIQFHLLHKRDQVRLQQQMVCALENKPAPKEEQAKGFKVEDEQYIIVSPEELEETVPESSRRIEVHEFIKQEEMNPLFLDRVYYLSAGNDVKEFNALVHALAEMRADGICTWTMRKRAYWGSLQAKGKMLRLNTLRYADEVVSVKSLELPEVSLSEKELAIAADLVHRLSAPFEPARFRNEHQKKLQELIDKKARGEKIAILRPKRVKHTDPDKLLQALEASLKKVA